jgi:hypothetical protein
MSDKIFSERITQYIDTVVQKLSNRSANEQDAKLKIVEEKCAEKADETMTKKIMAAIRTKLMQNRHTTPSVITGLSITNTMINGPTTAVKKRPLPLASVKVTAAKKPKVAAAAASKEAASVTGHLLSDGFIVDDTGEGTLLDENIDEEDDDDDDEKEDDYDEVSDEEMDPVFDHGTYTDEKGKIDYAGMKRAVKEEVQKRRRIRAQTLLGGQLATHVLPKDDDAFNAIRAKHAQHQLNKTNAQIMEVKEQMKSCIGPAQKETLAIRIEMLQDDAEHQQKIINLGGGGRIPAEAAAGS